MCHFQEKDKKLLQTLDGTCEMIARVIYVRGRNVTQFESQTILT